VAHRAGEGNVAKKKKKSKAMKDGVGPAVGTVLAGLAGAAADNLIRGTGKKRGKDTYDDDARAERKKRKKKAKSEDSDEGVLARVTESAREKLGSLSQSIHSVDELRASLVDELEELYREIGRRLEQLGRSMSTAGERRDAEPPLEIREARVRPRREAPGEGGP
jgi:hypothetical protein